MGCPRAGCAGWPWSRASARGRAGWCFVLQAAFLCSQLEFFLCYGPRHPQRRYLDVPVLFNGTTAVLDAHVTPLEIPLQAPDPYSCVTSAGGAQRPGFIH